MNVSHLVEQLRMRGPIARNAPRYALRTAEYAWIAAVRKQSVLRIKFGSRPFAMHFQPMGQGEGARGMFMFREGYEPLLTYGHELIGPGDTVLDVGANQGVFAMAFGTVAARVIAVEPIPWQAERVRANIALNSLTNTDVVEAAISNTVGRAELSLAKGDTSASIVPEGPAGQTIDVATTTIDAIVEQFGLDRLDFVKLDVEGAELMALEGAQQAIAQLKPKLCLEASDMEMFARAAEMLSDAGYRMYRFDRSGQLYGVDRVTEKVDNVFFLTEQHERQVARLLVEGVSA